MWIVWLFSHQSCLLCCVFYPIQLYFWDSCMLPVALAPHLPRGTLALIMGLRVGVGGNRAWDEESPFSDPLLWLTPCLAKIGPGSTHSGSHILEWMIWGQLSPEALSRKQADTQGVRLHRPVQTHHCLVSSTLPDDLGSSPCQPLHLRSFGERVHLAHVLA